MKLSEEKQVHYKALCEKICLIKNTVTPSDFYQNLQPENETVIVASPHIFPLSVFYGFGKKDYFACGKEHPEFLESVSKNDFGKKYDTAIMDLDKEVPYQGKRVNTFTQWFRHVISQVLKDGGTLKGKFPLSLVLQLQDKDYDWFQVEKIKIDDNHCFVEVVKTQKHKKTKVEYPSGEVIQVDIHQDVILHHYNQEYYDYLRSVDLSTSCARTTIDGKGDKVAEQLAIRSKRNDFDKVLFVPSNGNKAKAFTFDEVKDKNSGGDAFFAESVEQRDQFIQILQNPKVINLIKEMCYNNYTSMKLDHKKFIFNERIFSFANS
jgi:hypothetical protein